MNSDAVFQLACTACGNMYEVEYLELGNTPDCPECGGTLVVPGKVRLACIRCGYCYDMVNVPVNESLGCPDCEEMLSVTGQDFNAVPIEYREDTPEAEQQDDLNMTIGFARDAEILRREKGNAPSPVPVPAGSSDSHSETSGSNVSRGTHSEIRKSKLRIKQDTGQTKVLSLDKPAGEFEEINQTVPTQGRSSVPGTGGLKESKFGKYTVIREIARGGMGIVYLVEDPDLRRNLALKVLIEGEGAKEEVLKRFLREARASANLRHPNIIAVHEMGQIDGQYYFTMDFIQGPSFREIIEEREGSERMAPRKFVECMRDVCGALHAAHEQGIYHRDLKPANIMLQDETQRVILMDFGLAKDTSSMTLVSMTGQVFGSPAYMSPEQAQGMTREIDHRTDIYSMGVILYEGLTSIQPFSGETVYDTISMVVNRDPIPPRKLNPTDVDERIQNIILKCIEKDPAKRYQSMLELIVDLDAYLAGKRVSARGISLLRRAWRQLRKHPVVAGLCLIIPLLVVAFVTGWYVFRKPSYVKIAREAIASGDFQRQLGALRELSVQLQQGKIKSGEEKEQATRIVRKFIKAKHPDMQILAVECVGNCKDAMSLPFLMAISQNASVDRDVRVAAVKSIGMIARTQDKRDKDVISKLISLASDTKENQAVRIAAIENLDEMMSRSIIPALVEIAENPKESTAVRVASTNLLGKRVVMGSPAMKNLVALYADSDKEVSRAADNALKHARQKESIFSLYGISTGVGNAYRGAAKVELLNKQHNDKLNEIMNEMDKTPAQLEKEREEKEKPAVPPYKVILEKMADPDSEVRAVAAFDLIKIGDGRAVPALQKHLSPKEDAGVIKVVAKALIALAPQHRPDMEAIYELLDNKKSLLLREQAVYLVGELDGKKALPELMKMAREEKSRRVQAMLAMTFKQIGDPTALSIILAMLRRCEKKSTTASLQCADSIASFEDKGVPFLIDALSVENGKVKKFCQNELREITGEDFGTDVDAWKVWLKGQEKK